MALNNLFLRILEFGSREVKDSIEIKFLFNCININASEIYVGIGKLQRVTTRHSKNRDLRDLRAVPGLMLKAA